jgi:hypothetical protein
MGGGYQGGTTGNVVYDGPVGGSPASGWQVTTDTPQTVTGYVVCAP